MGTERIIRTSVAPELEGCCELIRFGGGRKIAFAQGVDGLTGKGWGKENREKLERIG